LNDRQLPIAASLRPAAACAMLEVTEESPMRLFAATVLLALATTPVAASKDVPIPKKIPSPVSEETAPTVTIRSTEDGDRIEEYSEGGKIYMVRVTPVRGPPYTLYDDDRNGRLDRASADENAISPVYWTIYEWD
jgi:hypothetical protein